MHLTVLDFITMSTFEVVTPAFFKQTPSQKNDWGGGGAQ